MSSQITAWAGPALSEYSYGTALTIEVVAELGGPSSLVAAPLVPSLQRESELGFDVAIEASWLLLCLQFKVAKKLVRKNAGQAAELGVPYWRFAAKTGETTNGTSQHNTLCQLQVALHGAQHGFVYYAAPTFDEYDEFSRLAMAGSLVERSAFPAPMLLGPTQIGDPHCFAYANPNRVRAYSEPSPESRASFQAVIQELEAGPLGPRRRPEAFLREVVGTIRNLSGLDVSSELPPQVQVTQHCLALGVQPFLVGRDPDVPVTADEEEGAARPLLEALERSVRAAQPT